MRSENPSTVIERVASKTNAVFDRSGFAACDDLNTDEWKEIYNILKREQDTFLSHEEQFRSPGYRWPRDPLHTWSRLWEYAYVFYHLRRWLQETFVATTPSVVDLGSGVTFLPFAIAKLGCNVTCVDPDPVVGMDIPRAAAALNISQSVTACVANEGSIPLASGTVDALFCVSVLEHVTRPDLLLFEIGRVLRPGGLLLLTIDVALRRGGQQIDAANHDRLIHAIDGLFDYEMPDRTVHPLSWLTTDSSPFPYPQPSLMRKLAWKVRHPFDSWRPISLACQAFSLRKKRI